MPDIIDVDEIEEKFRDGHPYVVSGEDNIGVHWYLRAQPKRTGDVFDSYELILSLYDPEFERKVLVKLDNINLHRFQTALRSIADAARRI